MKNFSFKTKKSFHQSSDKRAIGKAVFFIVCALIATFLFRSILGTMMAKSTEALYAIRNYFENSTAVLPAYVRSRDDLNTEIAQLNERIASQSGSQATIARLVSENEELRTLLGDTEEERILGGVIARPPSTPYDLLVIDRGSQQGVKEGAIVYHVDQHAIGVVSRVYETMSFVTLFSSSGMETTVYLYGPDVFAYAYGEGGGVIRISLPQGIEVHEGDSVVLPSLHMGDLGIVEHVVSLPTQPEQNAYLTFPVPIQSIRSVAVSKEPMNTVSLKDLESNVEMFRKKLFYEIPETLRLGTATGTLTSTTTEIVPSTTIRN